VGEGYQSLQPIIERKIRKQRLERRAPPEKGKHPSLKQIEEETCDWGDRRKEARAEQETARS